MSRKVRYHVFTALGTLGALGFFACGGSESAPPGEFDEFGVSPDELGVEVVSCSQAGSSGYSGTTLTLTMGTVTTLVLSVDGTKIKVNGYTCVDSTGAELSKSTAKKIVINGTDAQNDKVIVDLLPGTLGYPIFSNQGGITVDLGSGTDSFMVRGTGTGSDTFTMGVAGTAVFAELSGDAYADVMVSDTETFAVSLSSGNDTFTAAGGAKNAAHLASGVTALTGMTAAVTVYGGDGNDTLTGGLGNDIFYGGAGSDSFLTDAGGADGEDKYFGGDDTDTMSYASRTDAVVAILGPTMSTTRTNTAVVTGTVDVADGGGIATETLKFSVDSGPEETVTFATPANVAAIITAVNAVHTGLADNDGSDHLRLTGATSVEITGGTALALLGFTSDALDGKAGEKDFISYDVENLTGGTVGDTLTGSNISNTIQGGAGADTLFGGVGNSTCANDVDVIKGDAGNDTFNMSAAADCGDDIYGGADTDTVTYHERTAAVTITINSTANDGATDEGDNVRTDVEEVFGGTLADSITGSTNAETLHGGPGNDTINGGSGDDTIIGGTGDDTLNGEIGNDTFDERAAVDTKYTAMEKGYGNDIINGGAGFDKVTFADRAAALTITTCVDTALTGAGECTANDGETGQDTTNNLVNVEHIVCGSGADSVTGSSADETFEGGAAVDTLSGGGGNDTLFGDAGLDNLDGGDGDDYLDGGNDADNDTLDGDGGDGDICVAVASDVVGETCEL